ncbi:MAG: methyltransferase [Gammaproteobacteria bacterium]
MQNGQLERVLICTNGADIVAADVCLDGIEVIVENVFGSEECTMRELALIVMLALSAGAATATAAEPAPSAVPAIDPAWKVPEVLAFIGLKEGDKVADIVAGRLTAALAKAVGPAGTVYAVETAEIVKAHPEILGKMQATATQFPNIIISADPVNSVLPSALDAVFIRQNYHDLYDKVMGPADVLAFNKAVFAALKPGGVYVVLDHVAAEGSGISATETLHRIDPARVKSDVLAAGFSFEADSLVLANPGDDHTKMVFDPSVRGTTDQFLYRFRKPQ